MASSTDGEKIPETVVPRQDTSLSGIFFGKTILNRQPKLFLTLGSNGKIKTNPPNCSHLGNSKFLPKAARKHPRRKIVQKMPYK
jgi:hypothetical protein